MIGKPLEGKRLEEFSSDVGQIASAVQQLTSSDGWSIFLALFARRREEILEKGDYESIADFRADRKAIAIVENLFGDMAGYVTDAEAASTTLKALAARDSLPKERGIMILDAVDEAHADAGGSMEG